MSTTSQAPPQRWPGHGEDTSPAARPRSPRQALVQLAVIVAVVVLAAVATGTTDVLVVVLSLVVMIMLHELGHFATAKWSHMKVTEYFLGFGPRLWSVRRGETEYGIKAIPAGGYVRIVGMSNLEDVDPADEARSYRQQPFHNRLMVALAGSAMHALMAFVLLWVLFGFVGVPDSATSPVKVESLAALSKGVDPAKTAGFRPGDVVVSIDGRPVHGSDRFSAIVKSHAGKPITVVVRSGGTTRSITVTPVSTPPGSPGRIGVLVGLVPVHTDLLTAVGRAATGFGTQVTGSVSALGHIFSAHGLSQYWDQLTNAKAATASQRSGLRIQSIYGAARTAVQGVESGAGEFLAVMISINIFVGMLNLLPMLPLDGGHVVIAVYERIRSRKGRMYHADAAKLLPYTYAFVLFLGFVFVSSLYLDITHPIANPFH